ncbi:MAG: selenocysteine-specific translation elongation factor [Myxococcales bacterium]|nr:selenocysteine-specific translation elongation factor [Myxococcales bacterium]
MIIIGTAGHIDHGKTTLATKLTGILTDRLKEEQERGISIELGFAYFDLPNGQRCGVIDVPGHERFVRQMIAGATGVDVVILVIAADEGVMPQTREHLDICRLLDVKNGLVALTKTDLVTEDWLSMVEDDVRGFVAGTFLENQPILHFSAYIPEVAEQFRSELVGYIQQKYPVSPDRNPSRPFKLSVDRAFSLKGFGTVVTGTTSAGRLATGDDVMLLPDGLPGRVRGIEVHGEPVDDVAGGTRTAINVLGLERAEVHRGEVLIRAGQLQATSMFDATLFVLSALDKPLPVRFKALVHTGTAQLSGTVVLLSGVEAEPGSETLAQVRLEQPTVLLPSERYVLRGFEVLKNHGKTIGGGRVLDPMPQKHRIRDKGVTVSLTKLRDGNLDQQITEFLFLGGVMGVTWTSLWRRVDVSREGLDSSLIRLVQSRAVVAFDAEERSFVHRQHYDEMVGLAVKLIRSYHDKNPSRPGISREELRVRIRFELPPRLFGLLLDELQRSERVVLDADLVRLKGFAPKMSGTFGEIRQKVVGLFLAAHLEPPSPAEAATALKVAESTVREALDMLTREGMIVRIRSDLFFEKSALDKLRDRLVIFLEQNGEITTAQFKDLTGTSRKYSIPLGEFFDNEKLTLRIGDNIRRLRRKVSVS